MKKKRGRPKGSVAQTTRKKVIQFKAYVEEHQSYEMAAREHGMTVSEWIRTQLNRVARQE